MNQSAKQRIVGTLVLLIAALVLLQVLLDGEGSYRAPLESRIPAPPSFEEPARVIPERPVILADGSSSIPSGQGGAVTADSPAPSDSDTPLPDDAIVADEESDEPAAGAAPADEAVGNAAEQTDPSADPVAVALAEVASRSNSPLSDNLPRGWSVRLGVFADSANAAALVDRLKASEHRAYTRASSSSSGPATAVYVGPRIDRAGAEQLLEQLRADFQLNGLIVPYEIDAQ